MYVAIYILVGDNLTVRDGIANVPSLAVLNRLFELAPVRVCHQSP